MREVHLQVFKEKSDLPSDYEEDASWEPQSGAVPSRASATLLSELVLIQASHTIERLPSEGDGKCKNHFECSSGAFEGLGTLVLCPDYA